MTYASCRKCGAGPTEPCRTSRGQGDVMARRHSERVAFQRVLDEAEEFNSRYPVGTNVVFWPGMRDGAGRHSRTRTPAWALSEDAVVSVEGYPGGIALTHVEVAV